MKTPSIYSDEFWQEAKMSEMVERICRAWFLRNNSWGNPDKIMAGETKPNWEIFESDVRFIIEAMKVPTEAMLKADMRLGGYGFGDGECYSADPNEIWTAMVQEALK